jgi:hypothetical protein
MRRQQAQSVTRVFFGIIPPFCLYASLHIRSFANYIHQPVLKNFFWSCYLSGKVPINVSSEKPLYELSGGTICDILILHRSCQFDKAGIYILFPLFQQRKHRECVKYHNAEVYSEACMYKGSRKTANF